MAQITLNSTGVASNGSLVLQSNGTTAAVTVDTSQNVGIGTASPTQKLSIGFADASSGFLEFRSATYAKLAQIEGADDNAGGNGHLSFYTRNVGTIAERARIDASGNLGIGTTSPAAKLDVQNNGDIVVRSYSTNASNQAFVQALNSSGTFIGLLQYGASKTTYGALGAGKGAVYSTDSVTIMSDTSTGIINFATGGNTERARIDSSGNLLVGTTVANPAVLNAAGAMLAPTRNEFSVDGSVVGIFNRKTDDGELIQFRQAGTTEGTISVSGTTVSYNGGHLSRWAQTTTAKDDSLVKGTVLSNLDAMNVYTDAEGNPVANEQLNKVKVSDTEGDANVAGVFVNWTHDEDHDVDEINMAMTGDMIIRIAQGVTVQRGDLLMSAGNGTAKPQGDDIVRSKTVAKVTSTYVTCTYPDGSFCVPCVLMAC